MRTPAERPDMLLPFAHAQRRAKRYALRAADAAARAMRQKRGAAMRVQLLFCRACEFARMVISTRAEGGAAAAARPCTTLMPITRFYERAQAMPAPRILRFL